MNFKDTDGFQTEFELVMKVGDRVQVINCGRVYSSYTTWCKERALAYLPQFKSTPMCNNMFANMYGEIKVIADHLDGYDILFGVLLDNNRFIIIGDGGLELCIK